MKMMMRNLTEYYELSFNVCFSIERSLINFGTQIAEFPNEIINFGSLCLESARMSLKAPST